MKIKFYSLILTVLLPGVLVGEVSDDFITRAKYHACEGIMRGLLSDFDDRPEKNKSSVVIYSRGELEFSWVVFISKVDKEIVFISYDVPNDRWKAEVASSGSMPEEFSKALLGFLEIARKNEKADAIVADLSKSSELIGIISRENGENHLATIRKIKGGVVNDQWALTKNIVLKLRDGLE